MSERANRTSSRRPLLGGERLHRQRVYLFAHAIPERLQVHFAIQEEPRGTADAVLAVEEWTGDEPFIVINSDNLYPAEALAALRAAPAAGCVSVIPVLPCMR